MIHDLFTVWPPSFKIVPAGPVHSQAVAFQGTKSVPLSGSERWFLPQVGMKVKAKDAEVDAGKMEPE
jgi:hypothetical protein